MKQALNKIGFEGLGTYWECELLSNSSVDFDEIKWQLINIINEFERKYSRFDENSFVSKLNKAHFLDKPPNEMIEMMHFAKKIFALTDGVFNISVGGRLSEMGYGPIEFSAGADINFWSSVEISKKRIEISKNASIDFGGFGKGWLIDEFARYFMKKGIGEYVINGGGDLCVKSNKPIEIYLENPVNKEMSIGQTYISCGALAASSTMKRSWNNYHHIIDPKSGRPSDSGVIASFVRADSALIADVMATVLIIRPDLNDVLSKKFNLKTILVPKN